MFLNSKEQKLTEEYLQQGYIIRPVKNKEGLDWIRSRFVELSKSYLKQTEEVEHGLWLNQIHEHVSVEKLNEFRLEMISRINAEADFRLRYFGLAHEWLECLVGNELAMQLRINLSIQLPRDSSSLLPLHADTWSGDSPFEVVVWVPFVDCYGTKTMYLLPPEDNKKLDINFKPKTGYNSEKIFESIASKVQWLEVPYGHLVVFDQGLPHGNRINEEAETRWSMNCRFKGVFTPYGDKKIGEFFEPITLRAASRNGMAYQLPEVV